MAEILEKMPHWAKQGRRETYPYDDWFDGQVWLLTRGVDFVQERRGMASRIRAAAQSRGLHLTCSQREMPNGTEVIAIKVIGELHRGKVVRNG